MPNSTALLKNEVRNWSTDFAKRHQTQTSSVEYKQPTKLPTAVKIKSDSSDSYFNLSEKQQRPTEINRLLNNNRNRLGRVLNEMILFQSNLRVERQKIPNMLSSKQSYQQSVYDKYKAYRDSEGERQKGQYTVNMTTTECCLTSDKVEFKKVLENKQRQARATINIFSKNSIDLLGCQNKGRHRHEGGLRDLAPSQAFMSNNDNQTVKVEGSQSKYSQFKIEEETNRVQESRTQEKQTFLSKEEQFSRFKDRFNDHLLHGVFFYNIKLNRKKTVLEVLKSHPQLIHARDRFGNQPIHYTVKRGLHSMTKILISMGANVDSIDGLKTTSLRIALLNNDIRMLKVTLSAVFGKQRESESDRRHQ